MNILEITKETVIIHSDPNDNKGWNGERTYFNYPSSRNQLESQCPTEIIQKVYAVWGDTPTVEEPTLPEPIAPKPTEIEIKLAMLESSLAATQLYMNKKAGV